MKAVRIARPGGTEVLSIEERPVPEPKGGEVLIKVAAAGVNRADVLQREGLYPMPPGAPAEVPGLEASGVVVAVGPDVARWKVGDEVCALLIGEGYAEYVAVPAVQCMPVPQGVSLVEAAGLPETYCTVWANLFERGRLAAGEVALIQGGTSGIGATAIQLAKAFGATVIATAGSDEKCAACGRLGADLAINYRNQDFAEAVRAAYPGGVDVILDIVGGDYIPKEVALLRREGRLVFVAQMAGGRAEIDFYKVLLGHLTITGSTLRSRSVQEKARLCAALEAQAWPLFAQGRLKPSIDRTFALHEVARAHQLMESSAHIGKILLVP
ncbi:NAD(P)H-quinone oxidoreductase [Delftia sp. Cs1-4]|uniref:NAD(P)H-quinone oxidoreductase n=1 Tax=Delftia sp. (strain Cs1-4) TaxID=742013 RepID=UPI0012F4A742|nr:NAD(P)H-quinone oxidoreductase [Delftia sp. Cs1-4]